MGNTSRVPDHVLCGESIPVVQLLYVQSFGSLLQNGLRRLFRTPPIARVASAKLARVPLMLWEHVFQRVRQRSAIVIYEYVVHCRETSDLLCEYIFCAFLFVVGFGFFVLCMYAPFVFRNSAWETLYHLSNDVIFNSFSICSIATRRWATLDQ